MNNRRKRDLGESFRRGREDCQELRRELCAAGRHLARLPADGIRHEVGDLDRRKRESFKDEASLYGTAEWTVGPVQDRLKLAEVAPCQTIAPRRLLKREY